MGSRDDLEAMEKKREKSLAPAGNRNTAILPVQHCYTDSVTPALRFTQIYICYYSQLQHRLAS